MNNIIIQDGIPYQQIDIDAYIASLVTEQTNAQAALDAANKYLQNANDTVAAAQARLDAANQAIVDIQSNVDPVIQTSLTKNNIAPIIQPLPPIQVNPS